METGEVLFKMCDVFSSDGISSNNIAAVDESGKTLDHISRDMATNCSNVDLYDNVLSKRMLEEFRNENLHKCF